MSRDWGLLTRRSFLLVLVALVVVGGVVAMWPTTTRVGVDYEVREIEVPLYSKALDFLSRHTHYRALASRLARGANSEVELVEALFWWTHQNIRPVPEGLPVIDDHVWNIVVRGYGTDDQAADVFSTLAVYAGIPAMIYLANVPGTDVRLALAAFRLNGKWRLADVARGELFRRPNGELATIDDIRQDPRRYLGDSIRLQVLGVPYEQYFWSLHPVEAPATLRGELQMPLRRLLYEISRAVGIADNVEWASEGRD